MIEEKKHEFCYKTTARAMLGLSPTKFKKLGLEPDREVPNPHYRSGPPSYLFRRERIEKLVDTPQVLALQSKPRKSKDWGKVFCKRYETKVDALIEVAEAMFNLNRYAKHDTCAARNRGEIYGLKNRLIKSFYQSGYSSSVAIHTRTLKKQICWTCDGTGTWYDWQSFFVETCRKCDGTGVYKPEKELKFCVFRFEIGDKVFVWHQPAENLDFTPEVVDALAGKINDTEAKPLKVARRKLSELKALVRWYLDN